MSSTHIYPYVYIGAHKITGEFYIGSRVANIVQSHADLGAKYRTSSKYVEPVFEEFEWTVIAEFFNKTDAYDFEQELIASFWGNSLLLNKSCFHGKARFSTTGIPCTDENRQKTIQRQTGCKLPDETRAKMSISSTGIRHTEETKAKIAEKLAGRVFSAETIENMKSAQAGLRDTLFTPEYVEKRYGHQRGKPLPQSTRDKMSASRKGRAVPEETRALLRKPAKSCTCPHCGKTGGGGSMMRWHFDNCHLMLSTTY